LADKKSIAQIAQERDLTKRTVFTHVEKIIERWPQTDISHLRPKKKITNSVAEMVAKIKKENRKECFLDSGQVRLRAIFKQLNEKITYDDIKAAMLFMKED